ncbi:hypothetical protein P875_00064504 [Aspergillus parasiticus SU-1]|uniref:Uncharacterized protein n=1 Tax=Aspergillus parasiticus (strain ATCC 56775 / NRRL 5862 / SRRC 143 / SU-1) TaxID=1403190 RepID=A0A0F0IA62_ASPPU|nr:hypothetical protein P875_00064504 [Aspergillus parasiticus SU-1]
MRVSITLLISTFVISAYAAGTPPPPFVNARPATPPPKDNCRCDDGSNRYDQVAGEWTQRCFALLVAPAHVVGVREDNLFTTDTYDLLSNVTAESYEAGSSAALASVIVQISEAAVRPALSVVNMVSACDPVTHVAPTSLAHRARYAVLGSVILKAAIAVITEGTVVLGTTVERTGGR